MSLRVQVSTASVGRFDKMLKGEMKSPYQINVKDDKDVSNFENIPDSVFLPNSSGSE